MPTVTDKKAPATPVEEAVDLEQLPHINAHPRLVPLFAQKGALRAHLADIGEQVTRLRRELVALPQDASFAAATARRTVSDQLSDLEREGARLEGQLQPLYRQIETVTETVRAELTPRLTRDSVGVFATLIQAMETVQVAQAAYAALCEHNRRLTGVTLLPEGAIDGTLPFRLTRAREWFAKLQ